MSAPSSVATALPERRREGGVVTRFDLVERFVHWSTAALMVVLIVTGAILYLPALALSVGHRALVENVHVLTGLGLVCPLLIGVAGPWRSRLVSDLRRLDRWTPADFEWFRGASRRGGAPRGKFNGGQKLEASFLGGAMGATLVTGVVMRYGPSSWISFATGATLVHDTLFFAITIALAAHVAFALSRPEQLSSMVRGTIPVAWAAKHAPSWLRELEPGTDAAELAVEPVQLPEQ